MNQCRWSRIALWVLAPMAALAGCQSGTRAVLTESPAAAAGQADRKYKSDMAVFSVGEKGRQTFLLAFQPTDDPAPAPAAPPPPGAAAPLSKPAAMKYRAYLLLVVNGGGGEFTIGQRFRGGQVTAAYYVYDAQGQLTILPDTGGTIKTKVWPLSGSIDPDEWWTSGSFSLTMGSHMNLAGEFMARPGPTLIQRFLRDHKL